MKPERALENRVDRLELFFEGLRKQVQVLAKQSESLSGNLGTVKHSQKIFNSKVSEVSRLRDTSEAMNKVLTRVVMQKRLGVSLLQKIGDFRVVVEKSVEDIADKQKVKELFDCIEQYVAEES